MGLVAITGGQSVDIADAFGRAGLEVPLLSAASYEKLAEFFSLIGGSYRNPLDAGNSVGMGSRLDNFRRLLEVLDEDAIIDAIVLEVRIHLRPGDLEAHVRHQETIVELLSAFQERSPKPFIAIVQAGHREDLAADMRAKLVARGIPPFPSFQAGARALRRTIDYWRFRAGLG
jgi:acyl-CoA synthetase (NDP forming)